MNTKYEFPVIGMPEFLFGDEKPSLSEEGIQKYEDIKEVGDTPAFSVVRCTTYGEPVALVFRNNGYVSIDEGTELESIDFDDPYLWTNCTWGRDFDSVEFSTDENVKYWEGCFNHEAIMKAYFPMGANFATFVGAFYVL